MPDSVNSHIDSNMSDEKWPYLAKLVGSWTVLNVQNMA